MKLTNLKTKYLGMHSTYYKSIDSTQKEVWRRINSKTINNGEIIIADIQTNGVGTHGRVWHTDEIGNVAFSFFVRTNCKVDKLTNITVDIACILKSIFKEIYNIELYIKQPNDLIINNRKVGGILTESKVFGDIAQYLVIGIGINTNQREFNKEISCIATSIYNEYGIKIDNYKIIEEFCNRFEELIEKSI